jgi:ectoine hydroxylase-related dioxygenase (phytanoyl-CoA dioxygenase family)
MPELMASLDAQGFCLVPDIADSARIEGLKTALAQSEVARAERDGQTYGARNLLHVAEVRAVAASAKVAACLAPLLGPSFRLVRGLFFDKTAGANWPVPWHQDLSLAVRERCDLPGWINWTVKRSVTHVQPPSEILARMVTMRLHLDDCGAENGPLRVIPGSHCLGTLGRAEVLTETQRPPETIVAEAGDALFMRPLILHASSSAQAPHHRRVLHLEFAPVGLLPCELRWADA